MAYPNIRVTGAGTEEVNGVYRYVYMDTGKPAYRNGDYYIAWFEAYASWWTIYTYLDGDFYTSSDDVATPDLITTWEVAFNGVEPVPTVKKHFRCPLCLFIRAFKKSLFN